MFLNILFAQNINCNMVGTKWGIGNVEIKRVGGSFDDSVKARIFYKKYDSIQIDFLTKRYLNLTWGTNKIKGKYRIVKTDDGYLLNVFQELSFKRYENGSFPFLFKFKHDRKIILNYCNSFVMKSKSIGVNAEIFYKKLE